MLPDSRVPASNALRNSPHPVPVFPHGAAPRKSRTPFRRECGKDSIGYRHGGERYQSQFALRYGRLEPVALLLRDLALVVQIGRRPHFRRDAALGPDVAYIDI